MIISMSNHAGKLTGSSLDVDKMPVHFIVEQRLKSMGSLQRILSVDEARWFEL